MTIPYVPIGPASGSGGTPVTNTAVADARALYAAVGSTPAKTVECVADVSAMTLLVTFETLADGTDIATVANGSITKSTNYATFNLPAATTTVERTLAFTVTNTANGEPQANGFLFVTMLPKGD